MSLADILDGAFKLLRANARTVLLIVATFVVPVELVIAFVQRDTLGGKGLLDTLRDPTAASAQSNPAAPYEILAFTYLVWWIVVPLVCGGVSRVVLASYLGGPLTAKEAIGAALRRGPSLLAATIIVHLAELVGLFACVIPAVFVMPFFVMVAPAISIEDLGSIAGIKRSIRLASRRYWPTLGVAVLAGLLAWFLGQTLGLVPNLVALFIGLRWGWILLAAGGILVSFVTIPLITIVATLLYLDARIRQEGFDLQVVAADIGLASTPG
jgi:hypothetical protein